jgi:hypothetical protein
VVDGGEVNKNSVRVVAFDGAPRRQLEAVVGEFGLVE